MFSIKGELLFLGTGGSTGIPMVGCDCEVCTSTNPKNKRMRPSALLTIGEKKILIDPGPDLRFQALRFGITGLDGVLITHTHFDHIAGLDELRTFYLLRKKTVPLLLSRFSYEDIKRRLPYLFREKSKDISLAAQLDFHILEDKRGKTLFQGIPLTYMTYEQGGMEVNGYRIGNFAYVSDIRNYPETIFEDLKGVKTLVLSALKFTPTQMHFSLEEASSFAKKIGAEQTFFMHIAHEMEHEKANATLPPGMSLAYDGLVLEVTYG